MVTDELRKDPKGDAVAERRRPWQCLALALIIIAMGTDLWRIANSLGDLYKSTTKTLDASELADANDEFVRIWFAANVFVFALAFFILYARRTHSSNGQSGRGDTPGTG
jgi:hypothetical protein